MKRTKNEVFNVWNTLIQCWFLLLGSISQNIHPKNIKHPTSDRKRQRWSTNSSKVMIKKNYWFNKLTSPWNILWAIEFCLLLIIFNLLLPINLIQHSKFKEECHRTFGLRCSNCYWVTCWQNAHDFYLNQSFFVHSTNFIVCFQFYKVWMFGILKAFLLNNHL